MREIRPDEILEPYCNIRSCDRRESGASEGQKVTPSKHRHPEIPLEVKRTEWGGREEGSGLRREVGEKMNFEFCESLLSERLVFKANFHLFGG